MREKGNGKKKEYVCPWCDEHFTRFVIYSPNFDTHTMKQKTKGIISSQVSCPKCHNLIPTWKKEELKNRLGRKHIHLR